MSIYRDFMARLCQFTEISRPGFVNLQRFYGPVVSIYRDFILNRLCQCTKRFYGLAVSIYRDFMAFVVDK